MKITSIGGIPVDATTSLEYSHEFEATTNPVEGGANVTDHVIRKPHNLSITGVITNAPFVQDVSWRAQSLWQELLYLANAKSPIDVDTSLGKYRNMVITSLKSSMDAESGDAVPFTATLQEVIIVGLKTVELEVVDQIGKPKEVQGPVAKEEKPETALHNILLTSNKVEK